MTTGTTRRSPEAFAHANGVRLCWDSFGNPAHPPLLLIMGLGAQMIVWDEGFCERLADAGLYVVRFDNRDVGRSSWLDDVASIDVMDLLAAQAQGTVIRVPYLLRDMAADTAALADALALSPAHIVGASMGGMIAQELAIHFPSHVRSLTCIMSSTGHPDLTIPTPEACAALMHQPAPDRDTYIANFCAAWRLLRGGIYPEDEARDWMRAGCIFDRGLNPQGIVRQLGAILASANREAALRSVAVPTLVIHGQDDGVISLEAGRTTAAVIPGARLHEIARMGHAIPFHVWDEVTAAIATHALGWSWARQGSASF